MLESYRLTARGSIVGGAKRVRYGFGGRTLPDEAPAVFRVIEEAFRDRFPELGAIPIERCWSGPIALALDFLPLVGTLPTRPRVGYAVAYAGHGIALASHCGRIAAGLLLGDAAARDAAAPLTERFRPPLPPEPLRWVVFRLLTGVFGAIDRRTDRRARHEAGRGLRR
jgi:glycine/D-amino acid oxidase-like deaminating enzyme